MINKKKIMRLLWSIAFFYIPFCIQGQVVNEIDLLKVQLRVQNALLQSYRTQLEAQQIACRQQLNHIIELYNIRNQANKRAVERFTDIDYLRLTHSRRRSTNDKKDP